MARTDIPSLQIDLRLGRPRLSKPLSHLGARGTYVPPNPSGSQRAIVRVWMHGPSTAQHLVYLAQAGKGKEGQEAALFTNAQREVDPLQFVRAAQKDPHQFRFAISPLERIEDQQGYVQDIMRHMERVTGRRLDWIGAAHYDTAHLHSHVVLRGRTRDGQPLYLQKDYLTRGIRMQAERLATRLLGREKEQSVEQAKVMLRALRQERHREQESERAR